MINIIALVLQGGGARGSYQVGAIEALHKRGIKFDIVVGTSIGAINASFVAANEIEKLKKLWIEMNTETVFGLKNNKFNLKMPKLSDFKDLKNYFDNAKIDVSYLKNLLDKYVDTTKVKNSNVDLGMTTYCLDDKKAIEIFKKDIPADKLTEHIIASAYLPIFKPIKIIDNKYYLDGGIFNNCPLSMLDYKKYEKIYIIKCYKNDIIDTNLKKDNVELIIPKESLGSQIFFNPITTKKHIKTGYYDTLRVLDKLDGVNYYIKPKSKEYYEGLFSKTQKEKILFEKKLYKNANDKKIIIKILEILAKENNLNVFKVYDPKTLISLLKIKMINDKKNKYYKFIKYIKIQ